ncbi:hypothetical protein J1907_17700 [Lysinibacillus sphaericus]|uniref:hypothetical protein n=1 Tax=Lysinibacillus sphaericus TaxID=1421 RepID=UPI00055B69BC|nr:hypothetical protein [Lysinibacillus sphaericus]QTB21560.1 hypothetical protein J1907_17700 [Lysinibacillus sphaericus]
MPKITNFAFCQSSDFKNGNPRVLNIMPKIEVEDGTFSFGIIFSITDFSGSVDHNGYVILKNPVGEELFETEPFFLEKNENLKETSKSLSGTTIAMEFSEIVFEGSGLYTLQIIFDDSKVAEFHIPILLK